MGYSVVSMLVNQGQCWSITDNFAIFSTPKSAWKCSVFRRLLHLLKVAPELRGPVQGGNWEGEKEELRCNASFLCSLHLSIAIEIVAMRSV